MTLYIKCVFITRLIPVCFYRSILHGFLLSKMTYHFILPFFFSRNKKTYFLEFYRVIYQ